MGWSAVVGSVSEGYVIFHPGEIQIILEEVDEKRSRLERLCPHFSGLSLRCRLIEAEYKRMLAQGVTGIEKLATMPWGG
jgi:hypothetical protein